MLFSENEDSIRSLSEHNSELNVDQPINEITYHHSSSSSSLTLDIEQTNNLLENNPVIYENESIMLSSILTDILNDRLTTETLAGNNPLSSDRNNRRSSFKLDKTTSIHSLSTSFNKQSNDFVFEKTTARNYNLGKHENWIHNATISYIHPFNDYIHQRRNKNLMC
ncbi:unnamed protein product [Adineta steineri]|uniref:Uncharacterized protein n=1 Tax=Adineta steineri TaxID=433720 RepID=A0A819XVV2_9BILA|nr:unnamed protein product [Adineta steineri]CAF4148221.1 unnamed protein product [Adineta steineri]